MALTKITGQVINTATDVTVGVLTVTNTLSVGGTVSVGGTLTYEDVTNVDSVGIITARSNILVGSGITLSPDGDVFTTGISTIKGIHVNGTQLGEDLKVGTGVTITRDGDIFTTGVSTFSSNVNIGVGTTGFVTITPDAAIKVKVQGTSEQDIIHISTGNTTPYANIRGDNEGGIRIRGGGSSNGGTIELAGGLRDTDPGIIKFSSGTGGSVSERARIAKGGQLLIGDTTARNTDGGNTPQLQVASTQSGVWARMLSTAYINSAVGGGIILAHSRNGTVGSHTILQDDDKIGSIFFEGSDGSAFKRGATIQAYVDGTPGSDDMPGRIEFATSADGSSSLTTNLVIDSSGRLIAAAGRSTARTNYKDINGDSSTPSFQFETANDDSAQSLSLTYGRNNTHGPELKLAKHRTATIGGNTIVQTGDELGCINFLGSDGTNFIPAAAIRGLVDVGTPGTDDMPGAIRFATTADGASTTTDQMELTRNGTLDFLVASNGIKFSNGHSVTPNDATPVNQIFDDYEEGELDWEIHKSDYLTTGSRATGSRVTYQKIGSMVHIQGWIRTDGTAPAGTSGKVAVLTDASGNRAQLPFTPLGNVAIPITFTRSFSNTTTASSLCLGASHAADDVYVHMNQSNNYSPNVDNCSLTTQTNLVIAFNGHYHTND